MQIERILTERTYDFHAWMDLIYEWEDIFSRELALPLGDVRHLALSLPDSCRITPDTVFEKKYDLVMNGRQNPVLTWYLERYAREHPDFLYVYCKRDGDSYIYYTSAGECLGDMRTRAGYLQLLHQSRAGFFSTPGIDGGEARTQGFNQVTPRFLELLACGCHVLARYKENPDTEYYKLGNFSPSISTYGQFEQAMDCARNTEPDMAAYAAYLENHYTSRRVQEFKEIMATL